VSLDLYVFDGDVPDDEATIGEWLEDDSRWGASLTPRLATFVDELERRYPSLDDDPDNSPWASWPLTQTMVDGRCCGFNIVWSQSERMSAEMRSLCGEHGLTLYDPQESVVLRPGASSDGPTKRRWWNRGQRSS
jgi:hypothetical protein